MNTFLGILDADLVVVPEVVLLLVNGQSVVVKAKGFLEEILLLVGQDVLVLSRGPEDRHH